MSAGFKWQAKPAVRRALPQCKAIHALCALMRERDPIITPTEMTHVLQDMGFNYYTALTQSMRYSKDNK